MEKKWKSSAKLLQSSQSLSLFDGSGPVAAPRRRVVLPSSAKRRRDPRRRWCQREGQSNPQVATASPHKPTCLEKSAKPRQSKCLHPRCAVFPITGLRGRVLDKARRFQAQPVLLKRRTTENSPNCVCRRPPASSTSSASSSPASASVSASARR